MNLADMSPLAHVTLDMNTVAIDNIAKRKKELDEDFEQRYKKSEPLPPLPTYDPLPKYRGLKPFDQFDDDEPYDPFKKY